MNLVSLALMAALGFTCANLSRQFEGLNLSINGCFALWNMFWGMFVGLVVNSWWLYVFITNYI